MANESHRQLVVGCEVENPQGERSRRYVAHDVYPLWRFLLERRHGMTVRNPAPCMWVPRDQWRRSDRLFSRAGRHEKVVRVTFRAHDEAEGITRESVRFVTDADFDAAIDAIVPQMRESHGPHLEWDLETGAAIATS